MSGLLINLWLYSLNISGPTTAIRLPIRCTIRKPNSERPVKASRTLVPTELERNLERLDMVDSATWRPRWSGSAGEGVQGAGTNDTRRGRELREF